MTIQGLSQTQASTFTSAVAPIATANVYMDQVAQSTISAAKDAKQPAKQEAKVEATGVFATIKNFFMSIWNSIKNCFGCGEKAAAPVKGKAADAADDKKETFTDRLNVLSAVNSNKEATLRDYNEAFKALTKEEKVKVFAEFNEQSRTIRAEDKTPAKLFKAATSDKVKVSKPAREEIKAAITVLVKAEEAVAFKKVRDEEGAKFAKLVNDDASTDADVRAAFKALPAKLQEEIKGAVAASIIPQDENAPDPKMAALGAMLAPAMEFFGFPQLMENAPKGLAMKAALAALDFAEEVQAEEDVEDAEEEKEGVEDVEDAKGKKPASSSSSSRSERKDKAKKQDGSDE